MPGAQCARSLVCDKKQTHEHSHHGHTGNHPAFPAQWFYGLLRALPGDQACLTPSPALLLADLTPASGRQNDTTWPYASALFVNCAAASTASRPAFVTIASRPSVGRDQIAIMLICPRRLKFRNRSGVAPIPNRLIGDLNEIAGRRPPEVPERGGGLEGRRRRDVPVTILRGAQRAPQDDVALCGNVAYFRLFAASAKLLSPNRAAAAAAGSRQITSKVA